LVFTIEDIEKYLFEVKKSIENNNYRIEQNTSRQTNIDLFTDYVIDEDGARKILLSLEPLDFSCAVQNNHPGFEHETLYIFGKEVNLAERFGDTEKTVALYIKFNKLENGFVIVISFHEQKYPLSCYFI